MSLYDFLWNCMPESPRVWTEKQIKKHVEAIWIIISRAPLALVIIFIFGLLAPRLVQNFYRPSDSQTPIQSGLNATQVQSSAQALPLMSQKPNDPCPTAVVHAENTSFVSFHDVGGTNVACALDVDHSDHVKASNIKERNTPPAR